MHKMTLSDELKWRGFINQTTFDDLSELDKEPITFYWGVDPSADSMTIGHLAIAMMIKKFIAYGHKPILLVGGATGLIGDPDGKKQERDLKSTDVIAKNVEGLIKQYHTIFNDAEFELVDNYDWFKDIHYLSFLRDIGKHLSMTQLLDREFVKARIGEGGSGISYAEFSYSLIQGYDFLHLYRSNGATLQVCGADQWGNSLAGVEMIRKLESGQAHVFAAPLVIDPSTGRKFGKTEAGAVWLDESRTSVFDFYQFWLNADDEGVENYLKIYTSIMPDEYNSLMAEFKQAPHQRAAQLYLAKEVTALVHGPERAARAERISDVLFSDSPFADLSTDDVEEMKLQLPTTSAVNILDTLVATELCNSKSEARRMVEAGAITVNGTKASLEAVISPTANGAALVKRGKNKFALVT